MATVSSIPTPQLSAALVTFAADAPDDWSSMLETARCYDRAGIDRLVVSDHVVFGEHLDAYGRPETGGTAGGRQPTGPDGHWLEPLTTLSVIAGMTERVRLGTGILLAALRRPAVLAKTTSTLDVLSGGRLDLGVGVGWQREEYEAAGLDFDDRGRLLDHTLEVLQTLWREQRAAYDAPELHFEAIHLMPNPRQRGGVPVWVSGTVNPRVVRRLARFGSGWIPWGPAAADPVAGIAEMRGRLADEGRDPEGLQVTGALRLVKDDDGVIDLDRTMEPVPKLAEAGLTDLRIQFRMSDDSASALEQLSEIVGAFRAAAGRPDA